MNAKETEGDRLRLLEKLKNGNRPSGRVTQRSQHLPHDRDYNSHRITTNHSPSKNTTPGMVTPTPLTPRGEEEGIKNVLGEPVFTKSTIPDHIMNNPEYSGLLNKYTSSNE